jgi:hypothetical protein
MKQGVAPNPEDVGFFRAVGIVMDISGRLYVSRRCIIRDMNGGNQNAMP